MAVELTLTQTVTHWLTDWQCSAWRCGGERHSLRLQVQLWLGPIQAILTVSLWPTVTLTVTKLHKHDNHSLWPRPRHCHCHGTPLEWHCATDCVSVCDCEYLWLSLSVTQSLSVSLSVSVSVTVQTVSLTVWVCQSVSVSLSVSVSHWKLITFHCRYGTRLLVLGPRSKACLTVVWISKSALLASNNTHVYYPSFNQCKQNVKYPSYHHSVHHVITHAESTAVCRIM